MDKTFFGGSADAVCVTMSTGWHNNRAMHLNVHGGRSEKPPAMLLQPLGQDKTLAAG
jgi:hypothetical protein